MAKQTLGPQWFPDHIWDKIFRMKDKGKTFKEIAGMYGCTINQLSYFYYKRRFPDKI